MVSDRERVERERELEVAERDRVLFRVDARAAAGDAGASEDAALLRWVWGPTLESRWPFECVGIRTQHTRLRAVGLTRRRGRPQHALPTRDALRMRKHREQMRNL